MIDKRGGAITGDDLRPTSRVDTSRPRSPRGARVLTRGGLVGAASRSRAAAARRSRDERVLALVPRSTAPRAEGATTNLVASCGGQRLRASLRASASARGTPARPRPSPQLMLGESDFPFWPPRPRGSGWRAMMAPTLVVDDDGLCSRIGSAGGTRLRTALLTAAAGILDEKLDSSGAAVEQPRVHPAGVVVNAEPGVDEDGLASLEAGVAGPCGAGRSATTTSAASVSPRGPVSLPIRGAAAQAGLRVDGDPAEVAAAPGSPDWRGPCTSRSACGYCARSRGSARCRRPRAPACARALPLQDNRFRRIPRSLRDASRVGLHAGRSGCSVGNPGCARCAPSPELTRLSRQMTAPAGASRTPVVRQTGVRSLQ